MADLAGLFESGRKVRDADLTQVLCDRIDASEPYTWASATMLVATNPCWDTTSLDDAAATASIHADLPSLAPHPYTLAARVYHKMLRTKASQSILYSGVSDAGKTHVMERVTHHLLAMSASHTQHEAFLAECVECAHHLVHVFGQARTLANEHASRHATYWELHFSSRGRLAGAKVLTLGLDKHRLDDVAAHERTFAVVYEMLAGATPHERAAFRLDGDVAASLPSPPTRDDARAFEWTRKAFSTLGFKEKQVQGILRTLAAILHVRMIEFDEHVNVSTPEALTRAADVLQVRVAELQQSLVTETFFHKNERKTRELGVREAYHQRDALARNLYAILFTYVIERINQKIASSNAPLRIAQLDTPGFVQRSELSAGAARPAHYDDFCKNYMADLVRHIMLRAVLDRDDESEAAQAIRDGMECPETHVPSDCMSLLRGAKVPLAEDSAPGGILKDYIQAFKDIDDGVRDIDNDAALFHSLEAHTSHRAFIASQRDGVFGFDVQHALGTCAYSLAMHQRSDHDALPVRQLHVLRASQNVFIAKLMAGPGLAVDSRLSQQQVILRAQSMSGPLRRASRLSSDSLPWPNVRIASVLEQLDESIVSLLRIMRQADTWHVFCVRAMDMAHLAVDRRRVAQQVHALGVTRLVRAKHQNFVKMPRPEFEERFGEVNNVASAHGWSEADYAIGTSFVYIAYAAWFSLDGYVGPVYAENAPVPSVRVEEANAPAEPDFALDMPLSPEKTPLMSQALPKESALYGEFDTDQLLPKELPVTGLDEVPTTKMRKMWTALTWALTWWMPSSVLTQVLGKKRPDVRMAWREKVAICILIFLLCASILFYIIGLGHILCPDFKNAWNEGQLGEHDSEHSYYVAVAGKVYDLTKFYKLDHSDIPSQPVTNDVMMQLAGKDLTPYFPVPLSVGCSGLVHDAQLELTQHENLTAEIPQAVHKSGAAQTHSNTKLNRDAWYFQTFLPRMKPYEKGYYVYDPDDIKKEGSWRKWAIVDDHVYDLSNYAFSREQHPNDDSYNFLPSDIVDLFDAQAGSDITDDFQQVMSHLSSDTKRQTQACLDRVFQVGQVDFRLAPRCVVQNYLLLSFSVLIFCSIVAKFVSALQLAHRPSPEQQERFVICHIPCYTEGEASLRKTIESLTMQEYDDKRKLLFIVCDGMVTGSGNEHATPRIVLDILGVDAQVDPEPLPFKSIATGSKQLNYGKVYSGLFECEGHVVPFVVVVKVGRPSERTKPGNRGKRDTQVMLMRYLNRVHYDAPMYPLELELYHHMKHVIGIDPALYEFVLMVDADTSIARDGLNRLVAASVDDPRTIAVCGETLLENEAQTFWTMIQVYEYYISHNLAKAFESLFGSVTCLPGCFSMYRLRSPGKNKPLFISDGIIADYSENQIDTLHKMNLFALGEDRYLTTLLLKHFPLYRTKFRNDAQALTSAPETFSVLLSQRRRWINSTVHNLVELVRMKDLCGFCLFSMRFIVFVDLIGTIILPATAVYMVYLIVTVATGDSALPIIAISMIAAVYGLQAIIFLLKGHWQYIGWMVIYLIAFPVYAFLLPIYSFWHMDDFSWGNTRIVVGEKGNKKIVAGTADEPFYDSMIPCKTVTEYQHELFANDDAESVMAPNMLLYDPPKSTMSHAFTSFADSDMHSEDYFQHTNLLSKRARPAASSSGHESWASQPPMWPLPMYNMMPGMPPPSEMHRSSWNGSGDPAGLWATSSEQHSTQIPSLPIELSEDPSDDQLRAHIRLYLAAQPSLMQVTKRHVRDAVAASMPNADLSARKAVMNRMIDELLSSFL